MISILGSFLGPLLVFGVSFVYPAYLTFRFLLAHRVHGEGACQKFPPTEYIQHVFYWVLYAWLTVFTSFFLSNISAFIPLYHELRAALFFWLASPDFKGAGWMWLVVLSPHYSAVDPMIRDFFDRFCPPSLKTYFCVATEGGEEAVEQAFRRDRACTSRQQLDAEGFKTK